MKQWKFNTIDGELMKTISADTRPEAIMIFLDIVLSQKLSGFQIKEGIEVFKRHPELMGFFSINEVLP